MKKVLFSLMLLLPMLSVSAQQLMKSVGYKAASKKYSFDESKINIPMKGYYILNNGTQIDAILAYQKPEFLIGDFAPGASLVVCKALTGKPMDVFNPDSEPNFKEYINKISIRGFYLDGHLYGNVPGTGWRIILSEGAIHSFITVLKVEAKSGSKYLIFEQTQKLAGEAYGSVLGTASVDRLETMIADASSLAGEVKNGTKNLYAAVDEYNVLYEKNNQGKITYILGVDGLNDEQETYAAENKAKELREEEERKAMEAADKEAAEYNKMISEAKSKAHNAPKHNYYDGRVAGVAAGLASAKPEVKVKKEKFMARINRIKADGNKVGVVVWCKNVTVVQKQTFSTRKVVPVFGTLEPLEGTEKWGKLVVEKLNKGFSTDVFEVVDLKSIPVKEVGVKKIDDWWATKYKIILEYGFKPYYDVYMETLQDSTSTTKMFKAQLKVDVYSTMSAAEDGNQKKLKGAGSSSRTSSYSSDLFSGEESTAVHTIQELKELVGAPSGAEIMNLLIKKNEAGLDKFIKKKSKK